MVAAPCAQPESISTQQNSRAQTRLFRLAATQRGHTAWLFNSLEITGKAKHKLRRLKVTTQGRVHLRQGQGFELRIHAR